MINIDELTDIQKRKLIEDKLLNAFLIYYPKLHKEIFEKLAVDEYWGIRCYLARNPNLPVSVIEELAVDEDSDVRTSLFANPSYQKYLLDKENGNVL